MIVAALPQAGASPAGLSQERSRFGYGGALFAMEYSQHDAKAWRSSRPFDQNSVKPSLATNLIGLARPSAARRHQVAADDYFL
jgi:hypothetical protein